VECRSEGAAEQVPVAVWLGGISYPVDQVVADATHGPARAGGAVVRRLQVVVEGLGLLALARELPDGEWGVSRAD